MRVIWTELAHPCLVATAVLLLRSWQLFGFEAFLLSLCACFFAFLALAASTPHKGAP